MKNKVLKFWFLFELMSLLAMVVQKALSSKKTIVPPSVLATLFSFVWPNANSFDVLNLYGLLKNNISASAKTALASLIGTSSESEPEVQPAPNRSQKILAIRWDGFYNFAENSPNYDIAKKMATGFSMGNAQFGYRKYRPWHAYDIPRVDTTVLVKDPNTGQDVIENRWYDVNFNGQTAEVVQQEVYYAAEAGLDGFTFNYYAKGLGLSAPRERFTDCPNKMGLVATYIMNQNFGEFNVALNEVVTNMSKDWWYKIDGKPVLIVSELFNPLTIQLLQAIRDAYVSPIYTIYLMYDDMYNKPNYIDNLGIDAVTWYVATGNGSYADMVQDEMNMIDRALTWNCDVFPTLTFASYIQGMNTYGPYNIINPGNSAFHALPTQNELQAHVQAFLSKIANNPRIKGANSNSFNEHFESLLCVCPSKDDNGNIVKTLIDWLKPILPNR